MKKSRIAFCILTTFILWTFAVLTIDVQPIGPNGSPVGLASLNRAVHRFTGVHMPLYVLTDRLSLIPAALAMAFALLGLSQWVRRRHILKVDRDILALGGFYVAVMAVYLFFEHFTVNFRPVLIDGILEASYPSSTTMLVMCVMPSAAMVLRERIRHRTPRGCCTLLIAAFTAFMVAARLISGVHWFTDIIGGALVSAGLVLLFDSFRRK